MPNLRLSNGRIVRVKAILATDMRGVIGYGDQLIFHNRDDLNFFRKKTLNHICLMGRKTFESIGRILPQRQTVIVTNHPDETKEKLQDYKMPADTPEPRVITRPLKELIPIAEELKEESVWVCGGASLYQTLCYYIGSWVVTFYRVDVQRDGVEMGLLPRDYDPKKLVILKSGLYTNSPCELVDKGTYQVGNSTINYAVRLYQSYSSREARGAPTIEETERRNRENFSWRGDDFLTSSGRKRLSPL
jgi:dihydrofolate reductase